MCADLADRLGVKDAHTDGGKTREDWCHELYEEFRAENPMLPPGKRAWQLAFTRRTSRWTTPPIPSSRIRRQTAGDGHGQDSDLLPELAEYAATWELQEATSSAPSRFYVPGFDGPDSNTEEYRCSSPATIPKAHTHSSYANNQIIQDAHRHNVWINPLDAAERNIETGDMVRVFNDHGEEILIEAKVTDRIMPGVGAIPQGMWLMPTWMATAWTRAAASTR